MIQVGDRLPAATFKRRIADGLVDVTTEQLCRGRRVVLFAVPGAFTATCSARHLPGYVEQAEALRARGVDTIACVAVNDPFVLEAWAESLGVGETVLVLSDGNATFTRAIGQDVDSSAAGQGIRSWRYAMILEDGVVRALEVEPARGQVTVSGAEALLARLDQLAASGPERVGAR
jgi:glutaredoxin/glutathione-dependent peroxiredoxin